MKKITLLLLLITHSFGFCQDCKYERNEVDEFTKDKILQTKYEWIGNELGYSLLKINDNKYLRLQIFAYSVFAVKDGAKLMFLTDKDEPITVFFPKYEISKRSTGPITSYNVAQAIALDNDLLNRLRNEKISKIRYYTTDGYIEKEIKEKRDKKLKELLKCIE